MSLLLFLFFRRAISNGSWDFATGSDDSLHPRIAPVPKGLSAMLVRTPTGQKWLLNKFVGPQTPS